MRGAATHVQLEGLHGGAVTPGDGREEPQHLLDDAVQVLEVGDGVQPERALGEQAAVVQEAVRAQLLAQTLQHGRVLQQLHDQRGAGAGGGGEGREDQLDGALLQRGQGVTGSESDRGGHAVLNCVRLMSVCVCVTLSS